ncbi:MAG: arsenate reductase ArsC [Bacteroidota bacterium]|nr:arsenate reductase ArsC [Bacteroidota bacterium]
MKPIKVLFICIHNSARSQMAEAFLKHLGGERYAAFSAGLEPGKLNAYAIRVMQESGIDISQNPTKDVFELHRNGQSFDFVITVCDAKNAESCPVFPGKVQKQAWWFDDPSNFSGNDEDKLIKTRVIRDEIKLAVQKFIAETR